MRSVSEYFPRLIEVYSDGLDQRGPGMFAFRPEFTTNGMFVINSEKIDVAHERGINVLDYDPLTGNHNFKVHSIIRWPIITGYAIDFIGPMRSRNIYVCISVGCVPPAC